MVDFITAKGARSLVEDYRMRLYDETLREILEEITRACSKGYFSVDIDITLENSVVNKILKFLKECDYKVLVKVDYNKNTLCINWKED